MCLWLARARPMVDGFLPGMGAADPVVIPGWKVRTGTMKEPKVILRIDPITGRPMDTSKPMAKRTGNAMGAPVVAAKATAAVSQGLKEAKAMALDMSTKHGIHGATQPDCSGIWKSGNASQKVELDGPAMPDDWLRTWKPARPMSAEAAAQTAGLILPTKEFVLVG